MGPWSRVGGCVALALSIAPVIQLFHRLDCWKIPLKQSAVVPPPPAAAAAAPAMSRLVGYPDVYCVFSSKGDLVEIIVSGPLLRCEKAHSLLFGWSGFHYALAFVEDTVRALSIAMHHITPDLSGPTRQTSLGCPASRNTGKSDIAGTLSV